ncbi:hypothetical protein C7974DRAFT_470369 [Boeremia exigua]|uniref:uncharacterized protein n=1 Tax=Boeremia exigua TaxID=749465 RepID=UPI001E8DCB21|nr:uncharacterized protein C7974DRAFT_470369 [Boeremia exigua]KAH6637446.1 hypothetical protein C7974DRAFT_470369 [Boeremia exigua]
MPTLNGRGVSRVAKKHKPIVFGSSFVRLLVGPHNRRFSVHENVLCSRSTYFKNRFQKVRKDAVGECAVCMDDLETAETVFCRTCGQNFHSKCMKQWLGTKSSNCPTCRMAWEKRTSKTLTHTLDQLDPDGFEIYVQWLYSHEIPPTLGAADDRFERLLRAHLVGSALEDHDFLLALRSDIVGIAVESGLSYNAVDFAYKNTHEPCALRRFLIDLYALTGSIDSLKNGNVSNLFLIDMAQSFMAKSKLLADGATVWTMMAAEGHIEIENEDERS